MITQLDLLMANPGAHPRSEAFSDILDQLGRQITTHFQNEEDILNAFNFPAEVVLSHVQAHDAILEQYTGLCLDLMKGQPLDHSEVLAMIKHWIIGHVESHDLKIRDYLPAETRAVRKHPELSPTSSDGV